MCGSVFKSGTTRLWKGYFDLGTLKQKRRLDKK
jgi:hypothetical protein